MDSTWPTTQALLAQLASAGIGDVQASTLASWRRAKLLDEVHQEATSGRGSVVFHPPDTASRVIAIRTLQAERDDLSWIGEQLWWRCGFPVSESLWRPELIAAAQELDPVLSIIAKLVAEEVSGSDDDITKKPLADQAAEHMTRPDIIMSRIVRRVHADQITPMLRLILYTAGGEPPDYEPITGDENESQDKAQLIRGLDFEGSRRDALAGRKFQFPDAIGPVLREIATALQAGTLTEAATTDRRDLEAAREDLRRGFEIVTRLYGSMKWIYGQEAFGLRFANWVVQKASQKLLCQMLLLWVLVRRTEITFLSSSEIVQLHSLTMEKCDIIDRIYLIGNDNPASPYLKPKYLKSVLSGRLSFHDLNLELESLTMGT